MEGKPKHLDDGGALTTVVQQLNTWRSRQRAFGTEVYDEPDWENGRFYFRTGYTAGIQESPHWADRGDWGAYIISPDVNGYSVVLHSLKGERATARQERVLTAFSRVEDAGKFVIARVANTLRVTLGLESLYIHWKRQGLHPQLTESRPEPTELNYMKDLCDTLQPTFLERHLKRYALTDRPNVHALPLPSESPLMNVMPLSFEDLDELLRKGL